MMLRSREIRAALQKHISPLAASRAELLATRLWHLLHDHVPDGDLFNRETRLCVRTQMQSKRFRWLGHAFGMPSARGFGLVI